MAYASDAELTYSPIQIVDGKLVVVGLDLNHSSDILKTRLEYDPNTGALSETVTKDDGSTVQTAFNVPGDASYEIRTIYADIGGIAQLQEEVYASGEQMLKYWDTHNTHPYSELDVTKDASGKITSATPKLDPTILAAGGSIGQIFGSAIGRSIAGSNPFAQLAAGTVGGYIGQQLGTQVATALQGDFSNINFAAMFDNFGVNIAGAAAGSVASFLTAELGTALGLSGFGAQLFNASVGAYAGSVLNQVVRTSLSEGVGAISWTSAFDNAIPSVSSAIGSLLATQIVHAENLGGAIGITVTVHKIDAVRFREHDAVWPVLLASSSPVIPTMSPSAAMAGRGRSSRTATMRSIATCSRRIARPPASRCGLGA
ncbi:hypothetical protein TM233_43780 [Bradyrhizobium sp. TM233]|nr:hypothetical protein TM233_43780 [Bradyrhizobium sp. TM233]